MKSANCARMRLIFVNRFFHPDHSATSQMLSELAFALAARGHEVHVVTSRLRYDEPAASLPPGEPVRGVQVHRVWTSRFGRAAVAGRAIDYFTFYVSAFVRLLALARPGTTLVAKTDPPVISAAAALAAWVKGARLVNWTQDLFPEVAQAAGMRLPPVAVRAVAAVRDWSLRRAARNVAISERMRERLIGRGLPADRVAVVHNWADGAAITPIGHPLNPLRADWGLQERFVIGYSGNLGRVHEFETVLGAAGRLREVAQVQFLFIGGGHRLGEVRARAAQLNLPNVRFLPYQPQAQLARSLGACDAHLVTLMPAFEGLVVPSKFYGILAAGRPMLFVGALEGDLQRLVREGDCGAVVGIGDAEGLKALIGRLARDPALGQRWGANARRLFDRRFAQSIAFDAWEQALEAARLQPQGTPQAGYRHR